MSYYCIGMDAFGHIELGCFFGRLSRSVARNIKLGTLFIISVSFQGSAWTTRRNQTHCYFNLMLDYIWDIIECDKSVPVQNNIFKVAPQRDIQGGLWHSNRASNVSIYHFFDHGCIKEQRFSMSACVLMLKSRMGATKSDAPNTQTTAIVHFISVLLM